MEFKIWDDFNKIMYYNAERINDDKWDFGRLHHNKYCTTCVSVGMKDKNDTPIFTYDLVLVYGNIYYVSEFNKGEVVLVGMNTNNNEKLSKLSDVDIEVVGNKLELG